MTAVARVARYEPSRMTAKATPPPHSQAFMQQPDPQQRCDHGVDVGDERCAGSPRVLDQEEHQQHGNRRAEHSEHGDAGQGACGNQWCGKVIAAGIAAPRSQPRDLPQRDRWNRIRADVADDQRANVISDRCQQHAAHPPPTRRNPRGCRIPTARQCRRGQAAIR